MFLKKWIDSPWFWLLAVAALFGLPLSRALVRDQPIFPPVIRRIDFAMHSAEGKPLGADELGGKVWVAGVFDLSHETMSSLTMKKLEHKMRKLAEAFHLVSLSMDPPERLHAYAVGVKLNPRRCTFAIGTADEITAARKTLGLDDTPDVSLALVDQRGQLRGVYKMPE